MNYKIITDENALISFIDWLPELQDNEKYYFSLTARNKYSNTLKLSGKNQVKGFISDKENILRKIKQLEMPLNRWSIRNITIPEDSLVLYININPRCMKKATEMVGKNSWDLMKNKNYNIDKYVMRCIRKSSAKTNIVDFDIDTDNKKDVDLEWLKSKFNYECYNIVESRGGYHILIDKRKVNLKNWFLKIHNKYDIDKAGNNMIPVVGTTQGGFTPKFIK